MLNSVEQGFLETDTSMYHFYLYIKILNCPFKIYIFSLKSIRVYGHGVYGHNRKKVTCEPYKESCVGISQKISYTYGIAYFYRFVYQIIS